MGDTPYPPEPEPSERSQQIADIAERIDTLYRQAVIGDPRARVRRVTLYVIAVVGIVIPWPALALVAVMLLAYTDAVVDVG